MLWYLYLLNTVFLHTAIQLMNAELRKHIKNVNLVVKTVSDYDQIVLFNGNNKIYNLKINFQQDFIGRTIFHYFFGTKWGFADKFNNPYFKKSF